MSDIIIDFGFDINKSCDIRDFLSEFHSLFSKILVNKCRCNIDYDFLDFEIIIDFIYQQICAGIEQIV